MKTSLPLLAATFAAPFAASPTLAQPAKLQPGLWEQVVTMKSSSGEMESRMAQMQQEMASMPPEQRKMVEDMMARQGVGMSGRNTTVRLCITPEQAARADMPQQQGDCTQEVIERSGSTVRFRFACSGKPPTSGEGEYTMTSPTAYSGRTTVLSQAGGKPEKMEMTQTGRWVAAECGSVKPRATVR